MFYTHVCFVRHIPDYRYSVSTLGLGGHVSRAYHLAGFLGCTTYFAAPKEGLSGFGMSILANLSGVFWAMVILKSSGLINLEILGYIATGIVSFLMCIQAKKALLSYIPGTFIGCCATFAANGNWKLVIPSLIIGVLFGYLMKTSGLWLHRKLTERQKQNQPVIQS